MVAPDNGTLADVVRRYGIEWVRDLCKLRETYLENEESSEESRYGPEQAGKHGAQSGGGLEGNLGYRRGNFDKPEKDDEDGCTDADGYRVTGPG